MPDKEARKPQTETANEEAKPAPGKAEQQTPEKEFGGREGPEPTRYGDWEVNGICTDF